MNKKTKIIIAGSVAIVLLAVLAFVFFGKMTKSPLDMVINDATYDEDIKLVMPAMTQEERTTFYTTMFKMVLSNEIVEGHTYRELLEMGKGKEEEFMQKVDKDMADFFIRDSIIKDSLMRVRKDSTKTEK